MEGKVITLEELSKIIECWCKRGYGNRKILLSDDDECNGYHEMFFTVTIPDKDMLDYTSLPYNVSEDDALKNYVILG